MEYVCVCVNTCVCVCLSTCACVYIYYVHHIRIGNAARFIGQSLRVRVYDTHTEINSDDTYTIAGEGRLDVHSHTLTHIHIHSQI